MANNPPSTSLNPMFPSTYQGRSYPATISPPLQPSNMEAPSIEAEGQNGEIRHEGNEACTSSGSISRVRADAITPPRSSTSLLQILGGGQYPLVSEVVRHLHQFDVNNLRGACRTLRDSLAPTYAHLVGSCQAMYPFQSRPHPKFPIGSNLEQMMNSSPRQRCPAGPTWPGPVRSCKGDAHKPAFGGPSDGKEYWICEPCHTCLVSRRPRFLGVSRNSNRFMAIGPAQEYAVTFPICRACFNSLQLHRPVKKHTRIMGTGDCDEDCTCLKKYLDEVNGGWYCADCAWSAAKKVVTPIVRRNIRVRQKYSQLEDGLPALKDSIVCAKCEKVVKKSITEKDGKTNAEENPSWKKDRPALLSNYYMCLGCEDLYVGSKDDLDDNEGLVSTSGSGSESEGQKNLHEAGPALNGMRG